MFYDLKSWNAELQSRFKDDFRQKCILTAGLFQVLRLWSAQTNVWWLLLVLKTRVIWVYNRGVLKADPLKSWSEWERLSMWAEIVQLEQKSGDIKRVEGECCMGVTQHFCKTSLELQACSQRQAEVNFFLDTSVCNSIIVAGKLYLHVRWEFECFLEFRSYELQLFSGSELDENAVVAEFRTLKIKIPRYKIGLGTVYLSVSSIFCRKEIL